MSQDEARPRRPRRRAAEEGRPRPRRKRPGGHTGLLIGLAVGCGVLLLAAGAVGVGVVIGWRGGAGLAGPSNPRVTEENFRKITLHMPLAEAEQVLGPGQRCGRAELYRATRQPPPKEGYGSALNFCKWRNRGDTILLEFDHRELIFAGWYVKEKPGGGVETKPLGF